MTEFWHRFDPGQCTMRVHSYRGGNENFREKNGNLKFNILILFNSAAFNDWVQTRYKPGCVFSDDAKSLKLFSSYHSEK